MIELGGYSMVEMLRDKMRKLYPYLHSDWECTKFPEGNWHRCCIEHDYDYATGKNKWIADMKLLWCVLKKGHPVIAPVMYIGVTVFGWGPYMEHRDERRSTHGAQGE